MQENMLEFKDSLMGEFAAAGRYKIYAKKAREEGLSYYADIFEELADNEMAHAFQMYKLLYGEKATLDNLDTALAGEKNEHENIYPGLSQTALKNNDLEAARIFKQIAMIEQSHYKRLQKLKEFLENDMVYKRNESIDWKCNICGYVYLGKQPPKKCPACQASIDHYFPQDLTL